MNCSFGQNQIELRHDNDFFNSTDRYYSSGIFITYRTVANVENDTVFNRQNTFYIGQEIYTPTDIDETDYTKFDRPYAGFLGLYAQHTIATYNWLFDFNFSVGVTGDISGAQRLQNSFHKHATVGSRIPTWNAQIKNGLTVNFYFNYIREWELSSNPFKVYLALSPTTAFGTKDIYLQNDLVFYFGRRNPLHRSIAYSQIGKLKNEFFAAFRTGYRYVFHDALLEGNLIKDSSLLLMEPYHNLFIYSVEIYFRRGRNDFKLFYNVTSAETKTTEFHTFATLSVARNF
jgi:hypothetical protein